MLRKILVGMVLVVAAAVACVGLGLTWAHRAIESERAPLPERNLVTLAPAMLTEHPVRLSVINTASQAMPRAAVLEPSKDPKPKERYVMSHPAFVIEWADGRILLVDVGMTRQGALDFGSPLEWLAGAAPIQPLGSTAERLGDARKRVQGIVFTHLHLDHVGGINELCEGLDHPVRVFMTDAQAARPNYTTSAGLTRLHEASCVREERLQAKSLMPIPGFDGVFVMAAGGHTPGSQVITTTIVPPEETGARGYVFTGDIANNIDGINYDIPKPWWYSLFIVPEDGERLGVLRRFLRDLHRGNNFQLLVSHDQIALEGSGVPAW